MKARIRLTLLLTAVLVLLLLPQTAQALGALTVTGGIEDVDYTYSDEGRRVNVLTGTELIISGRPGAASVVITAGVEANLTLDNATIHTPGGSAIHLFSGAKLNLTVMGDNSLKGTENYAGIDVTSGRTLVITKESTGTLTVTGGEDGAGIGGAGAQSAGTIFIHGGTVKAFTSGFTSGAAGIGGGGDRGHGGNITITGGTVEAKGEWCGAGIGGGWGGGNSGNITITGGKVNATGGSAAAGIGGGGGGDGENIKIYGGTVTAVGRTGGAGIGGGHLGDGGRITISGGTVNAKGGGRGTGIGGGENGNGAQLSITGGMIFADSNKAGVKDVGGGEYTEPIFYSQPTDGSLAISGEAALFLRNGASTAATTTTHTKLDVTGHIANQDAFGIPVAWSGDFSAYLWACKLSYDTNGGSGVLPAEVTQHIGTSTTVEDGAALSRIGYDAFSVWNLAADSSGVDFAPGDTFTFSEDHATLYAKWTPNSYTVFYDANGGAGSTTSSAHTYDAAKTLTPNGFSWTNYSFVGWATSTEGEVVYSDEASVINLTEEKDGEVWLYAKWMPAYTVHYDANGGVGSTPSSSHTYSVQKALTPNAFTKAGYTFGGWANSSEGEIVYENEQSVLNLSAEPGGEVTLYAKWVPNTYTVNYEMNGGTGGSTSSSTHTYDVAKALTLNGYTKIGYTFAGWATSAEGAPIYLDGASVVNLTAEPNGSVTLYAKWTPNAYTVIYHANGGEGDTPQSSYTYDEASVLTPNNFARKGYTFAGWATSAGGTSAYHDGANVSNLTTEPNGIVTLYAKWTPNTYTVSYEANGGELGDTAPSTHTYDVIKTLTTNGFRRIGYSFAGWSTSADDKAMYKNRHKVLNLTDVNGGSVTLYATWVEDSEPEPVPKPSSTSTGTIVNCRHSVNVRSGPGMGHLVIGTAPKGAAYTVLEKVGDWYKVEVNGQIGYISAQYFAVASEQLPQQSAPTTQGTGEGIVVNCKHSVNLRGGPGRGYPVIAFAPKDATYTILDRVGAWYKILINGRTAYISADYFTARSR